MKKFISLCLALILALALAVPASAAESSDVSVMVNGEVVAFPDGDPEISGGRTMVPMRAVLEKLGAEVAYDHSTRTVTAAMNGETVLTHVIGTNTIATGDGGALTMDAASYVSGGSTLVPLRFFSQVLGYEVYWDAGKRTAVVIDKNALIEQIDKSFTIINDLQAKNAAALDGNLAMEMDFSGSAKVSAPGLNMEYPFSMKLSALYGEDAMNISGDMDLSVLSLFIASVASAMPVDGEELSAEEALAAIQEIADMLKNISFEMIYSDGGMWMKSGAIADLLRQSGSQLPEGEVWMSLAGEGMEEIFDIYDLSLASSKGATMGSVLYAVSEMANSESAANLYQTVTEASQLDALLVGDDAFTKDGDAYTWKMDQAMMDKLAAALGASSMEFPGTMEMTIKEDGSCTFNMEMAVEDGTDSVAMTMSGTSSATESSIQGSIQVQGMVDITFQGTSTVSPSEAAPVTAPPAGEAVVDLAGTPMAQAA